jgi:4-amino-4-deoxy-L-arabinose transferase-like glycosyltransferase
MGSSPRARRPAPPMPLRVASARGGSAAAARLRSAVAAHAVALAIGVIAIAFVATRVALLWRFPQFVDETTFASFAKSVHGDIGQFFIAESDKKGLLPSWLGALLIGAGIGPVTAMRLLAALGAAAAAVGGGLVMRRLYGTREGLLTAALIALGPYFLVTASVGIYDAMVAGLVTAAVLTALHLARRPRLATALALGALLGAGGLTKPTTWAAAVVLPLTLLLFDHAAADRRRRLVRWAGCAVLALALGAAIAAIARLTSLYDQPIATQNQRGIGDALRHLGPILHDNGRPMLSALFGYLTPVGVALALVGTVAGRRRHPGAAAILGVWALAVLTSTLLLSMTANPRYLAAAIVPIAGFAALGALTLWDAIVRLLRHPPVARAGASAVAAIALLPALLFNASVLADPVHAHYPSLDGAQYVTQQSALSPLPAIASAIEARGGPYPVLIDVGPYPQRGDIGPWGLDLRLNGSATGKVARFRVVFHGTAAERAAARYIVTDSARPVSVRPGYRLIRSVARPRGGSVMRLYERR